MHSCLVCGATRIPVYRTFCAHCFALVPWRLRSDVMHAHRGRIVQPQRYTDVLHQLDEWINEQRGVRP